MKLVGVQRPLSAQIRYIRAYVEWQQSDLWELVSVECRAGDEQLEIRSEPRNVFDETKQNVGVKRSLMSLVHYHHTRHTRAHHVHTPCVPVYSRVFLSHNNNNYRFTALCPGLPGWASTRRNTHPPSWSSSNLYQLLPSTTIHSILPVQITCLAIFLHSLSPCPLWSTSWSGALHLIFHTFLHSISVFFSQHMPIPSQPVLL